MRLLSLFFDIVFPPRGTEALVREAVPEMLGPLARPAFADAGIVALLPYRDALARALVVEAKFRANEKAQALLGTLLADYLCEDAAPVLVPVPLSEARLRERGYNQAERICRAAAAILPEARVEPGILSRTRDTLPQTSLGGRARRRNLEGAFRAEAPDPERTYILVDDVVTTGTTLKEAVSALRRAGARRVSAVALAH